jgi:hypothetical protein
LGGKGGARYTKSLKYARKMRKNVQLGHAKVPFDARAANNSARYAHFSHFFALIPLLFQGFA